MSHGLWCLQRCDLFRRLTPDQIQRLEDHSRCRTFSRGSPVCLPSGGTDSVFLLASGLVEICHLTPDGKKSILTFVEPGEMFGELAIFDPQQRDEHVEAVEASTVVMIPTGEMHHLMSECSDVAIAITKLIGLRRHRIERRLKNLLFLSNRDRLIHLLLDLSEQFGWLAPDGIRLRVKLTHQDLANLIGSTRETVTVILGQLRAEGSIDGSRQKLVLCDPHKLARGVNRQPPTSRLPRSPHGRPHLELQKAETSIDR